MFPRASFRIPRIAALIPLLFLAGCSDLLSDGYDYSSIEVQAVRRSGEPVPGVDLVLYSGLRHMAYGTTDEQGRFVFQFVPDGEYGIRAVPRGPYVPLDFDVPSVARDQVGVAAGSREVVSFTLLKVGPGSVEVAVRQPDGTPVPGIGVELYTFRGAAARSTTDPEGRVVFDSVAFGNYGVRTFVPRGFVGAGGLQHEEDVLVDAGSRESVRFALEPCRGGIRVRVVEPDGRPVQNAVLSLYEFSGEFAEGRTDANGAYQFQDVPCGNFGVALQPILGYTLPPGRGGSYFDDLQVGAGTELSLTFTPRPCIGRIRVRVADRAGAPVAGAELVLYTFRGPVTTATTGAGGEVLFERAPCGDVGVKVEPPEGYSVEPGRGRSYFDGLEVEQGGEQELEFVLSGPGQ